MTYWVGLPAIAAAANISTTSVKKAVQQTISKPEYVWRGSRLVVRKSYGRGGAAGVRYQVALNSLPSAIQSALRALNAQFSPSTVEDYSQDHKIKVLEAILRDLRKPERRS